MDRPVIDRWTDTTTFGVVLIFASVLVLPILALGLLVSLVMLFAAVVARTAEFEGAVIVVLSLGGAVGIWGWLRAHHHVKRADPRNPTATLLCLAVGAATAAAVAALLVVPVVETWRAPWARLTDVWPALPFIAANVAWAVSGIAWMQRLMHRYAERTGRAFDGMPAVMLLVVIALAVAAVLISTTL